MHPDQVGELGDESHVVADQDDGRPDLALELTERLHHLALDDDIEGARRLVGDDDLGVQHGRDRHDRPLLHPSGQLVRIAPRDGGRQPDLGQLLHDPGIELLLRPAGRLVGEDRVDHLVFDAHHRVERVHRALRHEGDVAQADLAERVVIEGEEILVAEEHPPADDAAGRPGHPHERRRHRRLAGTRLPDEPEALAGAQLERDMIHGRDVAGVRPVDDLELLDPEDDRRLGAASRRGRRRSRVDVARFGRHQSRRSRGFAKRSMPADVTNRARKMNAIIAIGGPHHHQNPRSTAVYCCDQ